MNSLSFTELRRIKQIEAILFPSSQWLSFENNSPSLPFGKHGMVHGTWNDSNSLSKLPMNFL